MELRASEHPLYEGHPSWRALVSFYALGLIAAIAILLVVVRAVDEAGAHGGPAGGLR